MAYNYHLGLARLGRVWIHTRGVAGIAIKTY